VKLVIELTISEHLKDTSFIQDENIMAGDNGLLLLHSNILGCCIGKVNILETIVEPEQD
jgi:hypothetical protein